MDTTYKILVCHLLNYILYYLPLTTDNNLLDSTLIQGLIHTHFDKIHVLIDTYGIIKTNRDTISEDITVPSGTNGLSSGPITISSGYTVTVNGEWAIV